MEKLVLACQTHTDGTISSEATVGVCFDVDRLDLGRVGIEPDPEHANARGSLKLGQVRAATDPLRRGSGS